MSRGSPEAGEKFREEVVQEATQTVVKFNENFFMKKHMDKQGVREESKSTEESKMDQSFYRK